MNKGRPMSVIGQTRANVRKPRRRAAAPDRRVARSKAALFDALIALVQKRDYDAITVGDIAAAADVGRSTFYAHFRSKDDLMRNGGGGLRAMLTEHWRRPAGAVPDPVGFSLFMFEHAREWRPTYRAFMRGRAGPIMVDKLRRVLADLVRDELATNDGREPAAAIPREFRVQYLVGAFVSVLVWWLDRGAKEPPQQMDAAFRSMALGGLALAEASGEQ